MELKKKDKITAYYSIESDANKGGKYHTHLLINYNDEKNLYNGLSRFIGGSSWEDEYNGFDPIKRCNGLFGEIDTHFIYDEDGFRSYMEKKELMEIPLI